MRNTFSFDADDASLPTRDQMLTALQSRGDLAFRVYADGGDRLADIQIDVGEALADLSGLTEAQKSAFKFFVHAGGNNVSANGAWPWTQALQDSFTSELTQILTDITNAGFEVILCPLTFRGYAEGGDPELNQDRAGFVNTNLVFPLIETFSPNWWDSVNSQPIMDLHTVSYQAAAIDNYFNLDGTDRIHPGNEEGIPVLRTYISQTIVSNPASPVDPIPANVIFTINASGVGDGNDDALPNVNRIDVGDGTDGSIFGMRDIRGTSYPGAAYSWSGWSTTATNTGGTVGPLEPVYLPTANHYSAASTYLSVNPGLTANITATLGSEFADREVIATLTSGRAAGIERGITNITSQAQQVSIEPDVIPRQIRTLNLTTDTNGEVSFEYALDPNGGGFAAYGSTISLEIDETVNITGPTTLNDLVENVVFTQVYNITNATTVQVTGTFPASLSALGGDQYLLSIDAIDVESQGTSGTLTISANNALDSSQLVVNIPEVENEFENTITSPGDLNIVVPEGSTIDSSYPEISVWIASSNATGNNVDSFIDGTSIPDGAYTVTFTLEDAIPVTQVLTLTTKLSPIVDIMDQTVLSNVQTTIQFGVQNDTLTTQVLSSLGQSINRLSLGTFELTLPPLDLLLGNTRDLTITVIDGVNPIITETVVVTIIDSGIEEIPDIIDDVEVANPRERTVTPAYVNPTRDNPVYFEFTHDNRIIDFSQATRIQVSSRLMGGVILDTDNGVGNIVATQIKDERGRSTRVLDFRFGNSETVFTTDSPVSLTLVVWDGLHPQGQVIVDERDNQFRVNFRGNL